MDDVSSLILGEQPKSKYSLQDVQSMVFGQESNYGKAKTDKPNYAVGEPVQLKLTVTNAGDKVAVFQSSNSQRYDFVIRAGGEEVWRWSRGRAFLMMLTSGKLLPGKSQIYEVTWDQKDSNGAVVPLGRYTVEGWQMGGARAGAEFTIH